ncbi:Concanavalin A-like lectin/glucanase, subgroup [Cynara cardunculus var. scolymus]|uniref:Concanavalin A-like lectin/glucanase, subgroup n=1 Tax=Cynara cardunculus var. scolymus TaxID=59895 RepID=A0A103Y2H4_CYNCS|nr:Concanavalin A-like lectin/glucanase, subgroup [Cynara cardunculus var. scolymus]
MRMAVIVLSFLLLIQSPIIFASGYLPLKACGTYHISYSSDSSRKLFYLNGESVSKDFFCKYVKAYHANHCFVNRNVKNGRRFLRNLVKDGTLEGEGSDRKRTKGDQDSVFKSKYFFMGGSGILILCGSFFCPCFWARRKDPAAHTVLAKEANSMDSTSSVEMNSVSDKIPASPLRVPPSPSRFSMSPKLDRIGSVHLTMSQVARATQNFSSSLRLGEGGFGTVYKAQLPDGQVVAIKRANKEHFEALRSEFKSEVELLAKIEHRNLVKLLGYVDKGNERLIITEYVPNGEVMDLVDPQLKEGVDSEVFAKMLVLAFQCAAPTRADRPDMKAVGEQLWAIRMDYLRHGGKGEFS